MELAMEEQGVAFDLLCGVAVMGRGGYAFVVVELGIHDYRAEIYDQVSLSIGPYIEGFTINKYIVIQ